MNPTVNPVLLPARPVQISPFGRVALITGSVQIPLVILIFWLLMTYDRRDKLSELLLWLVSPVGVAYGPFLVISAVATITGGIDLYLKQNRLPVFMVLALITLFLAPFLLETMIYQTDHVTLLSVAIRSAPAFMQAPLLGIVGISGRVFVGMALLWLLTAFLIMINWQSAKNKSRPPYLGIALANTGYFLFGIIISIMHHP